MVRHQFGCPKVEKVLRGSKREYEVKFALACVYMYVYFRCMLTLYKSRQKKNAQ